MTEYIASSELVGRRSRMSRMRWYSSGFRPSSAQGCSTSGVEAAAATVSSARALRLGGHAFTTCFRTDVKNPSPSVEGP